MQKTLQILRYEVLMVTSRFSFWLILLFLPSIALLMFAAIVLKNQQPISTREANPVSEALGAMKDFLAPEEEALPKGYVDSGGLIRSFPAGISEQQLVEFSDQISARRALQAREISLFYVIDAGYMQSGRVTAYLPQMDPMAALDNQELKSLINFNLLGGNVQLFRGIDQPIQQMTVESLTPKKIIGENNSKAALYICSAVMMLFSIGILGSATLLLYSLSSEKENRVIEMLMVSTSPMQLMTGKIAGLGLIGLVQTLVWSVSSLIILRLSGETSWLPAELQLQPSFIGWGVVFFLLGYLIYASIMAGIGAVVPGLRQANQISGFVTLPLIIPEFLALTTINNPHNTLAVILSLFPLTAPIMMMMRLVIDVVPLSQLLLSIALLALTTFLVIRVVAGLFRTQTILTGQGFRLSTILNLVRGVGKKD